MKIKKGDKVYIKTGKNKGEHGEVKKTYAEQERVLVEGVNLKKKHIRPKKKDEKGQVVEVAHPINVSNVQLICPQCGEKVRVGYERDDSGQKHRRCKKCEQLID